VGRHELPVDVRARHHDARALGEGDAVEPGAAVDACTGQAQAAAQLGRSQVQVVADLGTGAVD
jgi:hypothetical protein